MFRLDWIGLVGRPHPALRCFAAAMIQQGVSNISQSLHVRMFVQFVVLIRSFFFLFSFAPFCLFDYPRPFIGHYRDTIGAIFPFFSSSSFRLRQYVSCAVFDSARLLIDF